MLFKPSNDLIICNDLLPLTIYLVNGGWSAFGSEVCQAGIRFRSRVCNEPLPKNGGAPCEGSNIEVLQVFSDEDCKKIIKGIRKVVILASIYPNCIMFLDDMNGLSKTLPI